ncbi:hypothetical protein [Ornithinibacillus halotolerans]|uniref:Uncharacterized protein n=1 Tax=Ornithinibacillus halotolerans TaxID=1274357 RepID=A0A916S5K8_9BACI|nr:hypothetical protein [Ornithinibacillus halotolerans]GGA85331.1 hypothetical protein GCM10008025_30460 [Ornithinibacillus halotolerans]
MLYWIIFGIVLLIILEEGLYYLFNRLAFNKQPKEQLDNTPVETENTRKQRRLRRKH